MKTLNDIKASAWGLMLLATVMTACTTTTGTTGMPSGLPQVETFNESVVVAIATVEQTRQSVLTLAKAQKITVADEKNLLAQTDTAREGVDVARSLSLKDVTAAKTKLDASRTILRAISAYLATKQ